MIILCHARCSASWNARTGRQIFERGKIADEEDTADEGGVSVDVSQYDRRAAAREEEEEETDHVHFSDSD